MLPDCFGFAATLPSLWNHAGLLGFSTQKLSWGSANGIPFNFGIWEGPDGKGVMAALNATSYSGTVVPRLDIDSTWNARIDDNIDCYGYSFDFRYYGVGDVGGAPRESDVKNALGSIRNNDSKFKVILTSSDQIFRDITPAIRSKLPTFSGDLLLTEHSAGSLTSQSFMKRANRKNESLVKSAEQAAVMSDWLGAGKYPYEKLANAWELILGSQFHDILPGTSTVKAYTYAWNDEFIVSNTLSQVLVNSVAGITSSMNTEAAGKSVAVYNPVATAREDVVSVKLAYPKPPVNIKVLDKDGKIVPSQIISRNNNEITAIFLAKLPSAGISLFDIQPDIQAPSVSDLKVSDNILENKYFRVKIDMNGDIASIYDKMASREVLSRPAALEFQAEAPSQWPAWNMDWKDRKNPPFDFMNKDVKMRIIENGPVRVAIEIAKKGQNSEITQVVSLASGEPGKIIDVRNKIDWQSKAVSLKAAFPLNVTNEFATYSLNTAAITRTTNNPVKFEVPGRQWIDLTDKSNSYGVSILEDCKYGSDKPDNSTLRLTLMYTPKPTSYVYQGSQDWGIHEFRYGIYPHSGGWAYAGSPWKGYGLNNPPIAFEVPKHQGKLGREFSFVSVNTPKVDIMALKKAEESDYYIVRVNELTGKEVSNVVVTFPGKVTDAYEVNGQEKRIGNSDFSNGTLNFDIGRFGIRTFAIKFENPATSAIAPVQASVTLPYNEDGFSFDTDRKDGNFDSNLTMPAELIPSELVSEDIIFRTGSMAAGSMNMVSANGQKINLPSGSFNRLYILAAATEETQGEFKTGSRIVTIPVQKWTGFIGQHYSRTLYFNSMKVGTIENAFTKRDNIAWFASHYHTPEANEPYAYSYLFRYVIDLPAGTKSVILPKNPKIKIAAMTAAADTRDNIAPLQLLYDDFRDNKPVQLRWKEYVTESMKPAAVQKPLFTDDVDPRMLPRLKQYLKEAGLDTVIVKTTASDSDLADKKSGSNATAAYYPSGRSTKGIQLSGEKVPMLNIFDSGAQVKDTLLFDNGEGRILIDLQQPVSLDRINMFFENPAQRNSQNRMRAGAGRGPGQRMFSLWCSDSNPDVTGDPKEKGWKYASLYSGGSRMAGGNAASFVFDGNTKARYIMIVTEGSWHGTQYLNHVDVFKK
ncbi:MAG TPA: glycoside hydrolase family 38 C-terminal domain-containing protein, partial [Bacteroidales bacterium]|nr:glycoside hydrolase family 38 C-terminal domain-containing protein [Bacteroidales bacterium]